MATNIVWDSYYGYGDPEGIASFEKAVGRRFPSEYKEIVGRYNGAFVVNADYFEYFNNLLKERIDSEAGMFLPYGDIEGVNETMEVKHRFPPDAFPDGLVMFSVLGNGDALCFDYRFDPDTDDPPVVAWHHEGRKGEDEALSPISGSFREFLGLLQEEEDDDEEQ